MLEAPVDPTQDRLQDNLSQVKAVQLTFDRFAQHCASTYDDCPTGNDPEQADQRITRLLDKLRKDPAPTDGDEKLDGDLAAHAIANYLDLGEEGWGPLVKARNEAMERAPTASCCRRRTTTPQVPGFSPGPVSAPAARPRGQRRVRLCRDHLR